MTPPSPEPARVPRAAAYARANQGVDRYRQPPHRAGGRIPPAPPRRRARWPLNRKRFWFFTVTLVFAVGVGLATLSTVLASPANLAQDPPARGPAPTAGPGVPEPPAARPEDPSTGREEPRPRQQPVRPVGRAEPVKESSRAGVGPVARPANGGRADPPSAVPLSAGPGDPAPASSDGGYGNCGQGPEGAGPPGQRKKAQRGAPPCPPRRR